MSKAPMGFAGEARVDDENEAVSQTFSPEFRNRLDAIVPFQPLKQPTVAKIVDKFIIQLEAQLSDRNVTIQLSDAARDYLAKTGYDPAMGARPLSRIIQEKVKKPLAEELLFGKLTKGGDVKIDLNKNDELIFSYAKDKKTKNKKEKTS